MELLANKVHIKGMEVLLADKVHKQEPQHINGYTFHTTIPTHVCSSGMADATLLYCY